MSDKLSSVAMDITIDENNRIRVLPSEKYAASEKLKGESQKFVESIDYIQLRDYFFQLTNKTNQ